MPTIHPLFSTDGRVTLLVCEPATGVAVVVDPEPGRWRRYAARAELQECTIQAVLATRQGTVLPQQAPAARVCPTGAAGEYVQVRLGSRVREIPVGLSEAVLRIRGLMIGVVVVSTENGGELAFVLPDGAVIIGGGRLGVAADAEPVPLDQLLPDWTLGILEDGTVYTTTAPDGVFRRPIREEMGLRDTTRSRILRRLAELGGAHQSAVATALGL